MDSRMKKYNENSQSEMSRTKRNSNMYSSIDVSELSRIKTNNNVSVLSEAPKQIDIDKIKRYIYSKNENEERNSRIKLDLPEEEEVKIERKEPKDYDINSVLERARGNRESDYDSSRYKKVNSSEYEILKKIKKEVKEQNTDVMESIDELNTSEKTIVDLINDISKTKVTKKEDLFSDLMSDHDNTIVMAPITDEINTNNIKDELDNITRELEIFKKPLDDVTQDLLLENEKLKALIKQDEAPSIEKIETPVVESSSKMSNVDKSFFTNSLSFSKNDFEELNEEEEEKGNNFYATFAVIMIIVVLVATAVIVLNSLLDLNWF